MKAEPGFEGSYLGAAAKISPAAIMECKICWTVYDPGKGDDYRQVPAGTPFLGLPEDWSCPECGAPKEQFMVQSDPGGDAERIAADIARRTALLVADFKEIFHSKMRDVPIINHALHVEAVGFRQHQGRLLGVLVSPWFMNLVMMPAEGEDWSDLMPGAKEVIGFPSGDYEFIHNIREMVGGYKACSLFSPMEDFASQMNAVAVARELMVALFDSGNREETDRAAEIRADRETDLAARAAATAARDADEDMVRDETPAVTTRRALLTGGPGAAAEAEG